MSQGGIAQVLTTGPEVGRARLGQGPMLWGCFLMVGQKEAEGGSHVRVQATLVSSGLIPAGMLLS